MSGQRIWRVMQRVWTGLYRDRRALPALLGVPVGTVLLVGYVMRAADEDLTVGLVVTANEWQVRDAATFIEESLADDGVDHVRFGDVAAADEALRDGDADAYVVLDDAFVGTVLNATDETITVGLRGDDQGDIDRALLSIGHALSEAPLRVLDVALGEERETGDALDLNKRYVYAGEGYDSLDRTVPAIIAFASFLSIFTMAVVAFTQERFTRTLERMLATAASRGEVILGYMFGYAAEALLQTALILGVVVFVFDVNYSGSLLLVAMLTQLTAVTALAFGIFLSAFARTEQQAMQMLPIVMVPQLVLAGVLFPLDSLPAGLPWVARALPLTYSVDALRDVMVRGFGVTDASVLVNAGVLVGLAAGFLLLADRTLRRGVA